MPRCDHCMLDVSEREAIRDRVADRDVVFCCHGCQGIYRLIKDEGLDNFYAKREGSWRPGPSETIEVEEAAFADSVREADGQCEADVVIDGIRCASCVWLNEKALERTPGVISARVNYATHRARIKFDPSRITLGAVLGRIAAHGYTPKPYRAGEEEAASKAERRDLLVRFGTAGFLSMQVMLFSAALYAGYFQGMHRDLKWLFQGLSLALTTPVVFYSGWPFLRGSLRGIRNLHMNMDVLVSAGALAAYFYSALMIFIGGEVYFDTAAMIITFILLGRYLEAGAKGRASEAVTRLAALSPKEATVLSGGGGDYTAYARAKRQVEAIQPGSLVEVRPGSLVALDGVVRHGASEVDESMLTGEPRAVAKSAGSEVFGGTMNQAGTFIYEVTRTARDGVLAEIVKAVQDAQARRAPVQAFADRVVGVFVPTVIALSATAFAYRMFSGADFGSALMNAVTVLVIACPCALGLATPLAILVGTTSGASRGILIKGGEVIERTRAITHVALDKTGTLTEGRPRLNGTRSVSGMSEDKALAAMASLEAGSEHSLARAVLDASRGLALTLVKDFKAHPGLGVEGMLNASPALAGNERFLMERGIDTSVPEDIAGEVATRRASGDTVVYMALGGRLAALFYINDRPRPGARETVTNLLRAGYAVSMLTGDDEATARAVAAELGIEDVLAGLSPTDKAARIRQLKQSGARVAMVGDGINDAPALAEADVGVAVGRATDVSLECADIVLMHDEPALMYDALRLGRRTFSVIRQNLFWAFFYNMTALPLALAGLLHPIMAAAAMALSSLSVVGNSLRARIR